MKISVHLKPSEIQKLISAMTKEAGQSAKLLKSDDAGIRAIAKIAYDEKIKLIKTLKNSLAG